MCVRGEVAVCLFLTLSTVLISQIEEIVVAAETFRVPRVNFAGERPLIQRPSWPTRVLITNDDGIDAPGLKALVRGFSPTAEVIVVAPISNRSGSTSYASILSRPVGVETRSMEGAQAAYGVDGYPADCVLIALTGLLVDEPPDLVVSGINAGANMADAWAYSGTLGAARIAALHGIPAIAVSGGAPDALAAITNWVVRLVQTPAVRDLQPFQYLTVDAPDIPLSEIEGVSVVPRARGIVRFGARRSEAGGDGRQLWVLSGGRRQTAPPGTDAYVLANQRLAVTTMHADEQDLVHLRQLQERADELPVWEALR